jgi:hypothetical protein
MAELFDILLNELRLTKKGFNRILSIGLLFTLSGHFFVVEPYFSYKKEEKVVDYPEKFKRKIQIISPPVLSKRVFLKRPFYP